MRRYVRSEAILDQQDNIKVLLTDRGNWLAIIYITNYFDEDLKSNRTLNLNSRTCNGDVNGVPEGVTCFRGLAS